MRFSLSWLRYFLLATEILLLSSQISNSFKLGCDVGLQIFLVGHHIFLSSLILILPHFRKLHKPVVFHLFVFALFFEAIWNILGLGFFFKADWSRSSCMTRYELTQSLITMTATIVAVLGLFMAAAVIIVRGRRRGRVRGGGAPAGHTISQETVLMNRLRFIYRTSPPPKEYIQRFLEGCRGVEKFPILKEEEGFIGRYFDKRLESEAEDCVFCFLKMERQSIVSELGCGHAFHDECLRGWLAIKMECPACKQCIRSTILNHLLCEE